MPSTLRAVLPKREERVRCAAMPLLHDAEVVAVPHGAVQIDWASCAEAMKSVPKPSRRVRLDVLLLKPTAGRQCQQSVSSLHHRVRRHSLLLQLSQPSRVAFLAAAACPGKTRQIAGVLEDLDAVRAGRKWQGGKDGVCGAACKGRQRGLDMRTGSVAHPAGNRMTASRACSSPSPLVPFRITVLGCSTSTTSTSLSPMGPPIVPYHS